MKIGLSEKDVSMFTYSNMEIAIDEQVSVQQYENIIDKDIQKINSYLDDFLIRNNINTGDVDTLFLTGGTSLVPAIQHLFRSRFPEVNIKSANNFTSVAKGLAYSGYLFNER